MKETKIQELERRIQALEEIKKLAYPYIPPQPQFPQYHPNLHYHGQMPCYANFSLGRITYRWTCAIDELLKQRAERKNRI